MSDTPPERALVMDMLEAEMKYRAYKARILELEELVASLERLIDSLRKQELDGDEVEYLKRMIICHERARWVLSTAKGATIWGAAVITPILVGWEPLADLLNRIAN